MRSPPSTSRFLHSMSPPARRWTADIASVSGALITVCLRSTSPWIWARVSSSGPFRRHRDSTSLPSIWAIPASSPGSVHPVRTTSWILAPCNSGTASKLQSARTAGIRTCAKRTSKRPVMRAPVRRSAGRSPGADSSPAPSRSAAMTSALTVGSSDDAPRRTSTAPPCAKRFHNWRSPGFSSSRRMTTMLAQPVVRRRAERRSAGRDHGHAARDELPALGAFVRGVRCRSVTTSYNQLRLLPTLVAAHGPQVTHVDLRHWYSHA